MCLIIEVEVLARVRMMGRVQSPVVGIFCIFWLSLDNVFLIEVGGVCLGKNTTVLGHAMNVEQCAMKTRCVLLEIQFSSTEL